MAKIESASILTAGLKNAYINVMVEVSPGNWVNVNQNDLIEFIQIQQRRIEKLAATVADKLGEE